MGYWNTAYLRFSGSADVTWPNVSLVPIDCWTVWWQRIKTPLLDLKQLRFCSPGLHSVFDCRRKYTSQLMLKLQIKIWLEKKKYGWKAYSRPCHSPVPYENSESQLLAGSHLHSRGHKPLKIILFSTLCLPILYSAPWNASILLWKAYLFF